LINGIPLLGVVVEKEEQPQNNVNFSLYVLPTYAIPNGLS